MQLRFCVPALFGLEGLTADELRRLAMADVSAENGRVFFNGTWEDAAKANLWLRTGERVLLVLGDFLARTFDELFESVKALPLEDIIPKNGAFPVKGHSVRSRLMSIPDCQKIIKKAAATRLGHAYGLNMLPETGTLYQLQFIILNDRCLLLLDTTGTALHKRGYRPAASEAPIRETLAAAMVLLSRRRGDRPLCDPFCGSGTILIEAAMLASNRAPGALRHFAMEQFDNADAQMFRRLREETLEVLTPFEGPITGSDMDPAAIALAKENANRAGCSGQIAFTCAPFSREVLPDSGIIITNPPYGERLGTEVQARALYAQMGKVLAEGPNLGLYVITPDKEFERVFGKKADKKRKLYNGMIQCELYQYRQTARPAKRK
jgi:putative N6-adenine-specific DNA methylase